MVTNPLRKEGRKRIDKTHRELTQWGDASPLSVQSRTGQRLWTQPDNFAPGKLLI